MFDVNVTKGNVKGRNYFERGKLEARSSKLLLTALERVEIIVSVEERDRIWTKRFPLIA